jgi:two-component system response regulator FixJ
VSAPPVVLVVDDDAFMRDLLRRVFVNAGIAVETFACGADLLARDKPRGPAVALLDLNMPEMSGTALHKRLRERDAHMPVMFVTGAADVATAVSAMRNGAIDLIEKPFDSAALVSRVRQALVGASNRPASRSPPAEYARRLNLLTPREREVAGLLVDGHTSKMIARDLNCSFRTIEIHRARVMSKMKATNLAALVRMSLETDEA